MSGQGLPAGLVVKDRYRIECEIGRGGMGVVYRAADLQLHSKPVVVKVLAEPAETGGVSGWLHQRFQQELRALARLDHPGIVAVFDSGLTPDGEPFVVMQYVEGRSLRSIMRESRLHPARLAALLRQAAQALASAHARGIFHRDLKPENIMVQRFGESQEHVRIIDFGIAKVRDTERTGPVTETGTVAGTSAYMAPEQFCGQPVTAATDVYALGVIAYEALAGRLPFVETWLVKLFEEKLQEAYPRLREVRSDVPEEVAAVVARAMAGPAERRFQDIEVLGGTLARALEGWHTGLTVPGREDPSAPTAQVATAALSGGPAATPAPPATPVSAACFAEATGGAVPLDSPFYVVRPADDQLAVALARGDSIVLVKGARQMGKTSLLSRGLHRQRGEGRRVVLTDFQKLNSSDLVSAESVYLALGGLIADQLELEVYPEEAWNARRAPNVNFERFLRREVLGRIGTPLVWALDEVDRLFSQPFASEVFGLFRSWHNERSLDPEGPWRRLTMAIAYATEAHLFITDIHQSPFNVGTRIALRDFTGEEVGDLNQRHGRPLASPAEVHRFHALTGGQPFLVRRGFHALTAEGLSLGRLLAVADSDDGPYGDHLRRISVLLRQDEELKASVGRLVEGAPGLETGCFYRLRSAGIVVGESSTEAVLRCELYLRYLKRHRGELGT